MLVSTHVPGFVLVSEDAEMNSFLKDLLHAKERIVMQVIVQECKQSVPLGS